MNRPTHTLNPNTGREIQINGIRFWNYLKHGFKYDEKLNRLYDKSLPPGTTKYVPKSRMLSPSNRSMIIESAFYELLRDNNRLRGGKWVKITKEEAKAYDNDSDIKKIFVDDQENDLDDSSSSELIDIDEFEYDADGHAIILFEVWYLLATCHLSFTLDLNNMVAYILKSIHREEYTINPKTGRKIRIGTQTWKRLAAKYYLIDGKVTDQTISESPA